MKPQYANTYNVSVNRLVDGTINEIQLDFLQHYVSNTMQITEKGNQVVSVPVVEGVSSVALSRIGIIGLLSVLRKSLGDDFDDFLAMTEET